MLLLLLYILDMHSSMSMVDFNKTVVDLETKVTRQGDKIEELQNITKGIKSQLEENKNEFKKDKANLSVKMDQAIVMLGCI